MGRVRYILSLLLVATLATTFCRTPTNPDGVSTSPSSDSWVQRRVEAYAELYAITPSGRAMLHSLNVTQKVGRPAWFGSHGFKGETGLGQARPSTVAHELGHAYWGSFPVTGRPDLTWEISPGSSIASALAQYHQDLRTFLLQPPDPYEPLRERFRNLPNLEKGEYSDLLHLGEADIVALIGGNLNLVPPILRKYYDRYLQPGQIQNWDELLSWYLGLSEEDKRITDAYLGIAHIPKNAYEGLEILDNASVPANVWNLIQQEEKQRLLDFTIQFDLIVTDEGSLKDAAGVDRGFPFWRSYLREAFSLYKRHKGLPSASGISERAADIVRVFDTLKEVEALPVQEQVSRLEEELKRDPFLYNFLPIVKNRVLIELLNPEGSPPPQSALRKGTGEFVNDLRQFISQVDYIVNIGRQEPERGAKELEAYIQSLLDQPEEKLEQDVDIIFELFTDTDEEATRSIMAHVRDQVIVSLLEINPARTRFLLQPPRLLDALNIKARGEMDAVVTGIVKLLENSSGNFEIDRDFTDEVYSRLIQRAADRPLEVLQIFKDGQLPLPRFFSRFSQEAIALLSSDIFLTAQLIKEAESLRTPAARLLYLLVHLEPELAANVVAILDQQEENERLVSESLIYFAYDKLRKELNPKLTIDPANDGIYLLKLLEIKGEEWITAKMSAAIKKYDDAISRGEIPTDFLEAYRATLKAALQTVESHQERSSLEEGISRAFSDAGLEF